MLREEKALTSLSHPVAGRGRSGQLAVMLETSLQGGLLPRNAPVTPLRDQHAGPAWGRP